MKIKQKKDGKMSFHMHTTPGSTVHYMDGSKTLGSGIADADGKVEIHGIPNPVENAIVRVERDAT